MRDGDAPVEARSRQVAAAAGHGGRADQPRGLALVSRDRGRGEIAHRRHLVADRDWRGDDHYLARRTWHETRQRGPAVLRHSAATGRCRGRCACRGQSTSGNLCITHSWPGQARTVYGDHDRFVQTYFSTYKGKYFTGDGCRRDEDGYYWITGRVDDVINVSGHRMGTAEVESALVLHDKVAEAAVVGFPHDIKGQGIYCYVTLNAGEEPSDALHAELRAAGAERNRTRLPRPTISISRPPCPRHGRARSCGGYCARLPKMTLALWATRRRWLTRAWSMH